MSIPRTADTDDDGTGTTGTIINNSWKTGLYDQIDARWSRTTITSTGTQTVIDPSEADIVLFNNASDLIVRSIKAPASPAKPGKRLVLVSIGAGNVFLDHQDTTGTTAADRLVNFATSGATPLAAGVGSCIYVYDDNAARWRLIAHEQGAGITPTFAAGDYTAVTAGSWTLGSGDVTTQTFYLRGRQLTVTFYLVTTSVVQSGGNPVTLQIANTAWGGFTCAKQTDIPIVYSDNSGAATIGYAKIGPTSVDTTHIGLNKISDAQWGAATNTTAVLGEITFEVS